MNSASKNLDIFICASQEFRLGAFVTIASLIHHLSASQETTIHLLSKSFTEESLQYVESLINESGNPVCLDFKRIDLTVFSEIHEKQNGNYRREFSDDIYARFLIPSLFPDVSMSIYLDSDFMIQKDLSELVNLRDSETPLFATRDQHVDTLSHPEDSIDCKKFNLNPNAPYFNSGFLVLNLQYWDREDFIPNCIRISRETNLILPDQSILNIIFADKWESLESTWNHMSLPDDWDYAFTKSNVNYHFIGPHKPWIWPRCLSLGCIRIVHKYIDKIPREYIEDHTFYRKPYPLFLVKHHLKKLLGK